MQRGNADPFVAELNEIKNSVHTLRNNLFPKHQRPLGDKHWTEKNLEMS